MTKVSLFFFTLFGLVTTVWLIVAQGMRGMAAVLGEAGWGLVGVLCVHLVTLSLSGVAWKVLLGGLWRATARVFVLARWIREGVNDLLPVAQIGGHVAGARILALRGARAGEAGASVVVDVTTRLLAQVVFTGIGLVVLILRDQDREFLHLVLIGMAGAILSLAGFVLVQRWGGFKLLDGILLRLSRKWDWPSLQHGGDLHQTIQRLYGQPARLAAASLFHLLAWMAGAVELWVLLSFMGYPIGWQDALLVESLAQAVRTAGFFVPGALGIQEGGYFVLGTLVGLSPAVSLSLSLIKRVRDVVFGMPAIIVWQALEETSGVSGSAEEPARCSGHERAESCPSGQASAHELHPRSAHAIFASRVCQWRRTSAGDEP